MLRLKKLSELNDIYNFQDTKILYEIFENRAREMMREFLYNPRKCTSASLLSGRIHRFLSKSIVTLPTQAEIVDLFEFAIQIHNSEMFCLKLSLATIFYVDLIPHTNFRRNIQSKMSLYRKSYFSVENIDDPCVVTVAVNPKEYFEEFESQAVNKKHKGLRKDAPGMEFEDYAKRINSIIEIETFGHLLNEKQKQNRFAIKNNKIVLEEI